MTTFEERVRIEVADHVATVSMIRGEKHNALDPAMFRALVAATEHLCGEGGAGVRAVVLHGEGKSFCSGIDIGSLASGGEGIDITNLVARDGDRPTNVFQRVAVDWSLVPVPVIAAIHGNCFGGGMQIALGADIRIAHPEAKLSIMEIKWGLVPDMGITQTLPRLVRADVAKELTFTGRIVSGREAAECGLTTRTADDPLAAAQELAAAIAGRSPDAIRAGKRLYDEMYGGLGAAEALVLESELQQGLMGGPNQIEAVRAGMAREAPQFRDAAPAAV